MRNQTKRRLSGRTALLVDIENILGTTHFNDADVAAARLSVMAAAGVPADALVTVATSVDHLLFPVSSGWPGARLRFRHGKDGADLELADVALNEGLIGRFDRVVLASGDGIFAVVAAWLARHGVSVTVVSRPEALSRALKIRVGDVRTLSTSDMVGMTA